MKVTKDTPNPTAAAEVLNDDTSESTALTARAPMTLGGISGESSGNMKFPQLKIAYGVGKLAETFNQGDLVLDDSYLLAKRGDPLVIVVASVSLYWKQYIEKDARAAGIQPKTYATKQEAKAAGEIVDWPDRGAVGPKPTVSPAGVYNLLIQQPENVQCALFGFPFGNKLWCPARMYLDKKAHKVVIAEVQKAGAFSLASRTGGLLAGQFTLRTSTAKKPDGNTETLPSIKFTGSNSDADVALIKAKFEATVGSPEPSEE